MLRYHPHKPILTFPEYSLIATFRRREKRFLVEVETQGVKLWVHCNNSGAMLGLLRPGADVLISPANNPKRRLPYTLELIKLGDMWVGVNTLTPKSDAAKGMGVIPAFRIDPSHPFSK